MQRDIPVPSYIDDYLNNGPKENKEKLVPKEFIRRVVKEERYIEVKQFTNETPPPQKKF